MSDSEGSRVLLINVKNKEYKNGVTISFLIDFWKLGLKDYFRTPHRIRYVANTYSQSFTQITKEEALKYLVRGYTIAKKVGTPITPECQKWLEAFGVIKYKTKGSLYKCYLCDEEDLTSEQVERILEIAKKELKTGVAGTPQEEPLEENCEKCESEIKKVENDLLSKYRKNERIEDKKDIDYLIEYFERHKT